jgi:hypothetical protein
VVELNPGAKQETNTGFREDRLIGARASLVECAGGVIDLVLAQRLLYLLEHKSLLRCGWPVFGGQYVRTDDGPFLHDLHEQILVESPAPTASIECLRTFQIEDRKISFRAPVESRVISRKDREQFEQIFREFLPLDDEQVTTALEAECPEWTSGDGSVFGLKDVLVANGWEEADAVQAEAQVGFETELLKQRVRA